MIEQERAEDKVVSKQNRDPWLAVCLSFIVPGSGQFYARRKLRGIFFFLAFIALFIFTFVLFASSQSFAIVLAEFSIFTMFYIWLLIDAYRVTKRSNTPEFEADRKIRKSPWKVIFFSWLLFGSGYFVLGKKYLGISAIILIALFGIVPHGGPVQFFLVVAVCLHGYKLTRGGIRFNKELALVIVVVAIMVTHALVWPTAYALRYSVIEAFVFDRQSTMEPTIKVNDRIIANKLIYRFGNPKVGDIVIIKRQEWDKPFAKRVVAIGGERVKFENAVLYVNGNRRNFEKIDSNSVDLKGKENWWPKQYGMGEEYIVPQGHYYVIGDNLAVSWDSRNFGAIRANEIIGKVTRIYWPLEQTRVFK